MTAVFFNRRYLELTYRLAVQNHQYELSQRIAQFLYSDPPFGKLLVELNDAMVQTAHVTEKRVVDLFPEYEEWNRLESTLVSEGLSQK